MSFIAIGGALIGAAVSVGTNMMQQKKQKHAQEEAARAAQIAQNKQELQARKAEQFSITEGLGQGSQGQVNLQVDKNTGDGTVKDTKGLTL